MSSLPVAAKGDTTTGGGEILQGTPCAFLHGGVLAAYLGAAVRCDVHGMTVIAEATARITGDENRLARDGDRLACGHLIVVREPHGVFSDHWLENNDAPSSPSQAQRRGAGNPETGHAPAGSSPHGGRSGATHEAYSLVVRFCDTEGRPHVLPRCLKQIAGERALSAAVDATGVSRRVTCGAPAVIGVAHSIPSVEVA